MALSGSAHLEKDLWREARTHISGECTALRERLPVRVACTPQHSSCSLSGLQDSVPPALSCLFRALFAFNIVFASSLPPTLCAQALQSLRARRWKSSLLSVSSKASLNTKCSACTEPEQVTMIL